MIYMCIESVSMCRVQSSFVWGSSSGICLNIVVVRYSMFHIISTCTALSCNDAINLFLFLLPVARHPYFL